MSRQYNRLSDAAPMTIPNTPSPPNGRCPSQNNTHCTLLGIRWYKCSSRFCEWSQHVENSEIKCRIMRGRKLPALVENLNLIAKPCL